jgi:dihydroflavonol-4-reductase
MEGCDAVFHAAGVTADYWQQDRERLLRVNVQGTHYVVQAALQTGVSRLVFTSSQAALGLPEDGVVMDESHTYNLAPHVYPYGYSKALAEQEVQKGVAQGLDAIIVNPSVVLGPRDANLQNSRIILEVQRGLIPLVPPGGLNIVDAVDLGRGHVLALHRGRTGHRYLMAGHNIANLTLAQEIARVLDTRPPRGTIPRPLIRPLAWILDGANRLSPHPLPLSGDVLRMGSRYTYASNQKAVRELGFSVTPLSDTAERAVAWLRGQGYLA